MVDGEVLEAVTVDRGLKRSRLSYCLVDSFIECWLKMISERKCELTKLVSLHLCPR